MGLGTLNNRSAGQTILDTFFNDIHSAMNGDFVGRNTSGVPTSGQNLGTVAVPWGVLRATSLVLNGSTVDTSQITTTPNAVISGKTRSTSNQHAYLTPNGAAASFILAGATTNLNLDINSATVAVATDITVTGLTVAPSSNNTCLVNDSLAAGQMSTKTWGEIGGEKALAVDTMGSNISNLVGKFAAFKTGTEYFLAFVESTTKLSKGFRGFFYNSSLAPLNRASLTDNDVITLMSLGWVFVENNATTVSVSYTNPTWDYVAPTSPATNDYWYDLANQTWKRYDGASWAIISRTFVGWVVIDATNCVAARCVEKRAGYSPFNTVDTEISTVAIVKTIRPYSKVSVAGRLVDFQNSLSSWNMTTQLAGSADMYNSTEQASTLYYLYVKDTGELVISDIQPYYRHDLFGAYHPHNPWRCVAVANNDGSSNITWVSSIWEPLKKEQINEICVTTGNGHGGTNTKIRRFTTTVTAVGKAIVYADSAANGGSFTIIEDGWYMAKYNDRYSAAGAFIGISVDSAALTTSVDALTGITQWAILSTLAAGGNNSVTTTPRFLRAGSVVRAHTDGNPDNSASNVQFYIVKLPFN